MIIEEHDEESKSMDSECMVAGNTNPPSPFSPTSERSRSIRGCGGTAIILLLTLQIATKHLLSKVVA